MDPRSVSDVACLRALSYSALAWPISLAISGSLLGPQRKMIARNPRIIRTSNPCNIIFAGDASSYWGR